MAMRLGLIGLGQVGVRLAANFLKHGYSLGDVFQRRYGKRILDGDSENGMSVSLAYKDPEIACELISATFRK